MRRSGLLVAVWLIVAVGGAAAALAQELAVQLDPAHSRVDFSVGATLHTVHGDFRLKNGFLRLHPQTGAASGQIVVDAATGESGNDGRDHKMHQQVLQSARYPDIVFQPQRVIGKIPSAGTSQVQIEGLLTIHGQTHAVTAMGPAQVSGGEVAADLRFVVPYQQWGMKNPSTLFLRVSDKVEITVHAAGRLAPEAASAAPTTAPIH